MALAAGLSVASLVVGLVGWGTPRAGLLTAGLVPVAAGWAIVHGQHLAAYSALSWLSRTGPVGLPADLAHAVAEALAAPRAVVWAGGEDALVVAGMWPEDGDRGGPTTLVSTSSTSRGPAAPSPAARSRRTWPASRPSVKSPPSVTG